MLGVCCWTGMQADCQQLAEHAVHACMLCMLSQMSACGAHCAHFLGNAGISLVHAGWSTIAVLTRWACCSSDLSTCRECPGLMGWVQATSTT